jgi:hypothetical protein
MDLAFSHLDHLQIIVGRCPIHLLCGSLLALPSKLFVVNVRHHDLTWAAATPADDRTCLSPGQSIMAAVGLGHQI